jgi:hypothetical protein
MRSSVSFIVINIANFVSTEQFRVLTDELVAYIKSSPPAQDSKGVVYQTLPPGVFQASQGNAGRDYSWHEATEMLSLSSVQQACGKILSHMAARHMGPKQISQNSFQFMTQDHQEIRRQAARLKS